MFNSNYFARQFSETPFSFSVTVTLKDMTYGLEQVFLRLRGGLMEVLLVLEDISGARTRETLKFPTRNGVETVRRLAKHLANRGDVDALKKLRLRVEERGELKDDEPLRRLFLSEFRYHSKQD